MQIQVGPFKYTITASDKPLYHPETGDRCLGLAWPDEGRIEYDGKARPERRWAKVWHELGHLLKGDLDITESRKLDEESICNLMGLAMSMMTLGELIRLHVYVMRGIDAQETIMLPGMASPIPIVDIKDI